MSSGPTIVRTPMMSGDGTVVSSKKGTVGDNTFAIGGGVLFGVLTIGYAVFARSEIYDDYKKGDFRDMLPIIITLLILVTISLAFFTWGFGNQFDPTQGSDSALVLSMITSGCIALSMVLYLTFTDSKQQKAEKDEQAPIRRT